MKIARYFPPIVDDDDFEDYLTQVSSMKELLALPWVDSWAKMPEFIEWKITKNVLTAMMGGGFMGIDQKPRACMVAYGYYFDDRPYIIEEADRALPDLNDLPKV